MPRNAATNRFRIRNQNASIFINGTDGAAGNALSIANNASLSPTAAVTLEIRFRPTARKAAILFDNSTLGVTNSYYLSISAGGGLYWYSTIGGVPKNILGTTTKVKFDEWNMVNATYDGAAIKLFLNGSQLAETLAATGSMGTNSGPLRIGAYYSGGTSQTFQGSISQPRVYAAGCTLAEHQDRYYRSITSAALQAALVLDLNTEIGAGSTVTDLSGLGNNATMGASASWTSDSPFKSRKASVNANMVKNGDFEFAPPFTSITSTSSRWIDGTSGGSLTNDLFGWYTITGVGNIDYSFDSTVSRSGSYSMRLRASNSTGRGRVLNTPFEATTTEALVSRYGVPVQPNTTYTLSGWIKTTDVVGSSIRFTAREYSSVGVASTTNVTSFAPSGTADWTQYSVTFTTGTSTRYLHIQCDMNAAGAIMTAWFDDITLTPIYPEGRVPANGNLVKNFDFEVAPTFVAVPGTTTRWIDGTSAGSTTNSTYKWAIDFSGTVSCRFDPTVFYSGTGSMKLSTTAVASWAEISSVRGTPTVLTLPIDGIRMNPGVSYTCRFRMKTDYISGDATNGSTLAVQEYNAAASVTATNLGTYIKTTTDWTEYEFSFTANAATQFARIQMRVYGHQGAATLIMDAWFDDIYLAPTTNPGRVIIT